MKIDSFAEFVLEQLRADAGEPISARRMFGSLGLYYHETFFGIISRGHLYLRTTETTRPAFEERGMGPFRPRPQQTLKNYYEVPADILEDPDALAEWVRESLLQE
jgi:DNA transformation protein and related proteins